MSRVNIISLVALLGIVAWIFSWRDSTVTAIQERGLAMASPLVKTKAQFAQFGDQLAKPRLSRSDLEAENEKLQEEIQELRIHNQRLSQIDQENNQLRQALKLQQTSHFQLEAAEVIGRESSTWYHTIIIDAGSEDGVKKDDPVVVDKGLVGKVARTTGKTAEVLLLTDEACKVAARVGGTTDQGIIAGERSSHLMVRVDGQVVGERGGVSSVPNLRLRYMDKTAKVAPEMDVFSSGQGKIFPPNFLLGRIKSVQRGEITTEAEVVPSVDFSNLDIVFVVTGMKQ